MLVLQVRIRVDGENVLEAPMPELRDIWEETSFALERRQTDPACVESEQQGLKLRKSPPFTVPFDISTPIPSKVMGQ